MSPSEPSARRTPRVAERVSAPHCDIRRLAEPQNPCVMLR
jgi:hypothetical protein